MADDGIGVSGDEMPRIFLERVSVAKAGEPSSGLGLAVCKELAEAHGGRIWVETERTEGSFSFQFRQIHLQLKK